MDCCLGSSGSVLELREVKVLGACALSPGVDGDVGSFLDAAVGDPEFVAAGMVPLDDAGEGACAVPGGAEAVPELLDDDFDGSVLGLPGAPTVGPIGFELSDATPVSLPLEGESATGTGGELPLSERMPPNLPADGRALHHQPRRNSRSRASSSQYHQGMELLACGTRCSASWGASEEPASFSTPQRTSNRRLAPLPWRR